MLTEQPQCVVIGKPAFVQCELEGIQEIADLGLVSPVPPSHAGCEAEQRNDVRIEFRLVACASTIAKDQLVQVLLQGADLDAGQPHLLKRHVQGEQCPQKIARFHFSLEVACTLLGSVQASSKEFAVLERQG